MPTRYSKQEQEELLKWPRKFGVGFIEANVPEKGVHVEKWQEIDLSKVDYDKGIKAGKYDNGIAIRCGKTFFGKYLTALDFDSWITILAYFGGKDKIQSWANDTLIEWHKDWSSLHVFILTDEPLGANRKIAVDGGGYLEVRGEGQLLFVSPCTHTDGHKWQAVGKATSPKLLTHSETTRLKVKIDKFCNDYVSTADKERYQAYLENPTTILGVKQGRHDATLFIAKQYYWAYKDGWLGLNDNERFERAWQWHKAHCKPSERKKGV